MLESLANLAEKLGRFELAEQLYRQVETLSDTLQGKIAAGPVSWPPWPRQGSTRHLRAALGESWRDREGGWHVHRCGPHHGKHKPDPAQLDRVSGWLDQALSQPQNQRSKTLLLVGLGNLRERQELYQKAEDLYQSAVKPGDRNGAAPINQELIATAYNNLAWLMALKDGKGREALEYINRAIKLKGPLPDFLDTRGVVYLTVGDSQLAIDDLEKAVAARSFALQVLSPRAGLPGGQEQGKGQAEPGSGQDQGVGTERSTSPRTGGLSEGAHRAGSTLTDKPAHASGPNGARGKVGVIVVSRITALR